MENKYYTPDIEDIRIGYECEVESNHKWKHITLTAIDSEENHIGSDNGSYWYTGQNLRTSYLTKEQIEKNLEMSGISCIFDSDKCILKLYDDKNTYFYGICKSVNELKQLLEYIKYAI